MSTFRHQLAMRKPVTASSFKAYKLWEWEVPSKTAYKWSCSESSSIIKSLIIIHDHEINNYIMFIWRLKNAHSHAMYGRDGSDWSQKPRWYSTLQAFHHEIKLTIKRNTKRVCLEWFAIQIWKCWKNANFIRITSKLQAIRSAWANRYWIKTTDSWILTAL